MKVIVIRAAGINCDEETMHCWSTVGAQPELVHLNRLCSNPQWLDEFDVVTIPGGFSYGDDLGAGVIFAQRLALELQEQLQTLVRRGGGILGICNGFQILVKAGLLPGPDAGLNSVTVTYNDSARFEARWVRLKVVTKTCPFLTPGQELDMPVEHAEGRVVLADQDTWARLHSAGNVALQYMDEENNPAERYPDNPNGSHHAIAGLCDATGRILGLMPHPDRNFQATHHPGWTTAPDQQPDGLAIFQNAARHWQ